MIGGTAISTSAPRINTFVDPAAKVSRRSLIGTPIARLTAVALKTHRSEPRPHQELPPRHGRLSVPSQHVAFGAKNRPH